MIEIQTTNMQCASHYEECGECGGKICPQCEYSGLECENDREEDVEDDEEEHEEVEEEVDADQECNLEPDAKRIKS